jgi:hypothetical protein
MKFTVLLWVAFASLLPQPTKADIARPASATNVPAIKQLQAQQYAQEAQTWEAMKDHMYVIADALARAIAKQFPDKVR